MGCLLRVRSVFWWVGGWCSSCLVGCLVEGSRFAGGVPTLGVPSTGMVGLEVLVWVGSREAWDGVVGPVCAYYMSVQVQGGGGVVAVEEG